MGTEFEIRDDQPLVDFEGTGSTYSGEGFIGGWNINFGADGPAGKESLVLNWSVNGGKSQQVVIEVGKPISVDGGVLTFMEDGTFSFEPRPNSTGSYNFELVATDADGDRVSESFDVTVEKRPYTGPDLLGPKDDTPIGEGNLPGGAHPDDKGPIREIDIPYGYVVVTDPEKGRKEREDGKFEKEDENGKLVYNSDDNTL